MDDGRLGYGRAAEGASIGDLVICVDVARRDANGGRRTFVGLVLDKSISVYRIQVVDTGQEKYWPMDAAYLWKERHEY